MKKHVGFCTLLFAVFLSTACGRQENTNTLPVSDASSEQVMAASLENAGITLPVAPKLVGDTLYYMAGTWDNDAERYNDGAVYRLEKGGQEAVELDSFEEEELLLYFVDPVGAVYSLYEDAADGTEKICLRKSGAGGELVYDLPVTDQLKHIETITMGQAGTGGEVCLANSYGELFLFDGDGRFVAEGKASWDKDSYNSAACGLANAGAGGIFTYFVNGSRIDFQPLDLTDGKPGAIQEVQLDSSNNLSIEIYDGYDSGIYFSDSDTLWKYDVSAGEVTKVFGWGDTTIHLKGYMIDAVGALAEDELIILAHRSYTEVYFARIASINASELTEKQTITLGIVENVGVIQTELEEMASAFNRESEDYEIILESYEAFSDLQEKLVKGEGPDLISLSSIDITVLTDKGVLEDLTPYFAESEVIKEEELLPVIQRAGTIDGTMRCVLPDFQVGGYLIKKGSIEGATWNTDRFLAMGEAKPDAALLACTDYEKAYYSTVLTMIINGDLKSYIDWEKGECSFDDGRFASLLERIMALGIPPLEPITLNMLTASGQSLTEIETERFYQNQVLTCYFGFSSFDSFQSMMEEMGESAEWIGYPNEDSVPYNELISLTPLGINHVSENKEGAWAFLEFLLSKNYQDRKISFPVRQDSFEEYMSQTEMYNGTLQIDLSEEEREEIRAIIENAYWVSAEQSYTILPIIYEEAEAAFAGDKTPEEAAEIIQNRVQLYLQE